MAKFQDPKPEPWKPWARKPSPDPWVQAKTAKSLPVQYVRLGFGI